MIESFEDFNIMRQIVFVIAFCFISILVSAQAPSPDNQPQRTVEEVALKQTDETSLPDELENAMQMKYSPV